MSQDTDAHEPLLGLYEADRPRERLIAQGAAALSNAELLAILLRTGRVGENVLRLAERLLADYSGVHALAQVSAAELANVKGMGLAKSAQVLAALELGKRAATFRPDERPILRTAADAAACLRDMAHLPQEHVRVILLDNAARVVAIPTIYIGTLNASVLRTAEVYREALIRNCPAIILAHNHANGDPLPSPDDVDLTRTLIQAGELLDIQLIDHLIIAPSGWRSLKEMGLAFARW
jgi:DNA repair protein RadC